MTPRVDQHLVHARSPKTIHSQRGLFQFAGGNYPRRSDSHDIRDGVENALQRGSVSNDGGRAFMHCLQLPMAIQCGVPLFRLSRVSCPRDGVLSGCAQGVFMSSLLVL